MVIEDACRAPATADGYEPVTIKTSLGDVDCHYYPSHGTKRGAIFVGGAGGGFDTPVRGWLYPRLSETLPQVGIACLRVRYRRPAILSDCTLDVLAGVHFLESEGIDRVALVGHSFGGAVVIQAAVHSDVVKACATLSTQTAGADPVAKLSPRVSLLCYHGIEDEVLPPTCSEFVFRQAGEPRKLILHPTARHDLDEAADELPATLQEWVCKVLDSGSQRLLAHPQSGR